MNTNIQTVSPGVEIDLNSFDIAILAISGGKDSVASLLYLLEMGFPKEKIEMWHHDVDGREGSTLMDWPITRDYVKKLAEAFEIPLYYSWKRNGFEGEMTRTNSLTAPTMFEIPGGEIKQAGGIRGTPSTRRKFPQVSASLQTRYCSSSLKIDVCSIAIANQDRFNGKRILLITGERAEESPARAKYDVMIKHKTSNRKREVWQLRIVHSWTEKAVWEIIARHRVNPHPAYWLGFGRVSCMKCIFASPNQWASINVIDPQGVIKINNYEKEFGFTIRRDGDVMKAIARGTPYKMEPRYIRLAKSETFDEPIFIDNWTLPAGAFGESAGPI